MTLPAPSMRLTSDIALSDVNVTVSVGFTPSAPSFTDAVIPTFFSCFSPVAEVSSVERSVSIVHAPSVTRLAAATAATMARRGFNTRPAWR